MNRLRVEDIQMYATYIGDGMYLIEREYDDYHYWLITTDGRVVENQIALDPYTLAALYRTLKRVMEDEE